MSESCTRCETPLASDDIRCAVCALPVARPPVEIQGTHAKILRCEECAAAVTYTVEAKAPKCAFCGSVMHVETPLDPIEEADAYLPFTVSRDEATEALRQWLGTLGFFRPDNLKDTAAIDDLVPLWWVGWVFDADTLVSWTADSDAGARRSAWAPHSGQSPLTMESILVPASRGLTRQECAQLAPGFRLGSGKAEPRGAEDATIERFDLQRSAARQTIVEAVEATAVQRASGWVPGSRVRNVHASVLLNNLRTRRLAFPAYVLAYRYNDKAYRAVVHGQDSSIVFGDAPYAIIKIIMVVVGVVLVIVVGIALASQL